MSWKPQVKTVSDDKWYNNALVFETRKEAEDSAFDLMMRWTAVTEHGAVESDLPVTHSYVGREPYFGVYRVLGNGTHRYLSRSVTSNEKLARELADERSRGEVTMPDGRIAKIVAYPHIAKPIGKA